MKRRNRLDHEILTKSQSRRINHLMVRVLDKFEDIFPDLESSGDGTRYKHDLKNAFNDTMRASRDEMNDYDVEYRPVRLDDSNTLRMTRTMMETMRNVDFSYLPKNNAPVLKMTVDLSKVRVLDALRSEFDCGIMYRPSEDKCGLMIIGSYDIVNRVIPIMDRYRLSEGVRAEYKTWRDEVFKRYSNGE